MSHRLVAIILALLCFLMLAATAGDIGLTYDEPIYMTKGMQAWNWLMAWAPTQHEALESYWQTAGDQQPGAIKLIFGIITNTLGMALPVSPIVALRMGTMVLSALGVAALYLFIAHVWGTGAGLVGSVGLFLMPRAFTHMHLSALDAPVMALGFICVALVYLAAREDLLWPCVLSGVVFGLALGTKLNAFFVPLIILPWVIYYGSRQIAGWTAASMAIFGPLTFFVTWPWLWRDTIARFLEYFHFHLQHYHVGTTYFGQTWELAPWHYAPVMLLITTPPVLLVLAAVGIYRATTIGLFVPAETDGVEPDAEGRANGRFWQRAAIALLVWGAIINIAPSMLPFAPKYNGVRLFLPMMPYIAGLAGVGFTVLARPGVEYAEETLRGRIEAPVTKVRALLVVLAIVPCLVAVGYSFPLGMSYYNSLIGGPCGARAVGMEPTYWGDSFLQAVRWLNLKAEPESTAWINVPGFASSVQMYESLGMLRRDINISAGEDALHEADYVVVQHKQNEMSDRTKTLARRGQPLYAETLDGVPVVWVFSGDDPALKEPDDAEAEDRGPN